MSTSEQQDKEFLHDVVDTGLLERSINWIKHNLEPEDIFSEKELFKWASNYDPETVFEKSIGDLESWAERNGYIKE
jgi:hypothetical protein